MVINFLDNYNTAAKTTDKSIGFDPNAIYLVKTNQTGGERGGKWLNKNKKIFLWNRELK